MRQRTERGFSLLEMLAVVTILLILGAMSAPTLLRSIRRYQLESACRQVGNILVQTRYEAMRQNRRITTVFKQAPGSLSGAFGIDYNDNGVLDANEPRAQLPSNMWVYIWTWDGPYWVSAPDYTNTALSTRITFAPDGTVVRQVGGTWQIANNIPGVYMWRYPYEANWTLNDYFFVTVTPAGRVRLWKYSMAPPWGWRPMQ